MKNVNSVSVRLATICVGNEGSIKSLTRLSRASKGMRRTRGGRHGSLTNAIGRHFEENFSKVQFEGKEGIQVADRSRFPAAVGTRLLGVLRGVVARCNFSKGRQSMTLTSPAVVSIRSVAAARAETRLPTKAADGCLKGG